MEVDLSICLTQPPNSSPCIRCTDGRLVQFHCPPELVEASFPVADTTFQFDRVYSPGTATGSIFENQLTEVSQNFLNSQNTVVYTYGQKAVPKRQFLFGMANEISDQITSNSGVVQHILYRLFRSGLGESVLKISAYVLGVSESVIDLVNPENTAAMVTDSIKEGTSVTNLTKADLSSYEEAVAVLKRVTSNMEEEFADVLEERELTDPFPPYNPFHVVFSILKYPSIDAAESNSPESNSLYFISLGDSERPPLCGINLDQLNKYEKTHKTHSAVVGILGAIRCNRLRVPFTKSKLTSLMKRTYNQEKNNPYNESNRPTKSFVFMFVFADENHAEESFHTLMTARRITNVMGGAGVGPASRDLSVEKWRLEQDIVELKDELSIAKAVHEYKPCIYEQSKPIQNIQEEELKRITAINKKREEARAKAQNDMRVQAQKEAQIIIEQEEKKSNSNLKELEEKLKEKLILNSELTAERDKKVKEFDKQLEKIRKKKLEEEDKAAKLKEEIKAIEEELQVRRLAIEKAKQQLELLNMDHSKGREMILQGREETKQKRAQVYQQRRQQREQWLKEVEEVNRKVMEQVRYWSKEKAATGAGKVNGDEFGEKEVHEDIQSIQKFLSELLNIDEPKPETPSSERLRAQIEEYFETERDNFQKKLAEEEKRKRDLERAAEMYKARISEHQTRIKKDQLQEAMKKERHLEGLVEQVIQYLEHGCRMTKIPSKGSARKRYFFIAEDRKKFQACEMDEMGVPVNRKRPTTTVYFKDIKRILLGQHTPVFQHFGKGSKHDKIGEEAMDDEEGSYNPSPTQNVTPQNLHKYYYRSFSFEFKKGKTLDVITETDSDFEAWVVALKRLLGTKSDWEKVQDAKKGAKTDASDPPPTIEWAIGLEVNGKQGCEKLSKEEIKLCSTQHITPNQYLNAKHEIMQKAQSSYVTVYDVRTLSSLDLPRSQEVYEFFLMRKWIAMPTEAAEAENTKQ